MTTKPTQCAQGYDCDACKGIEGMTIRDWFAGQAMAVMIPMYMNENNGPEKIASNSYVFSDAMLKEREK